MHLLLAANVTTTPTDSGPSAGLGLVVFLILLGACVLLFISMSRHIKRLPATFDPPADAITTVDPEGRPQ